MVGMITCLTRITLCICLWFAVIVPCLAQEDPYPAYLAQLAVEITTAGNTPTQNFAYWGTQKDAAGWTDYYLVNLADPNLGRKLIIHVPLPGAKLSAAMIGDSTIDKIAFDQVMPDVATLNAGLGGEHCWGTLARLGEIAALKPSVIVVGCGNSDVYTVGTVGVTPEMSESEAALVNIMSEAKSLRVPIIVATLTPILSTLPTEPTMTPSVVAQRIRTFNTWLAGRRHGQRGAVLESLVEHRGIDRELGRPDVLQRGLHSPGQLRPDGDRRLAVLDLRREREDGLMPARYGCRCSLG